MLSGSLAYCYSFTSKEKETLINLIKPILIAFYLPLSDSVYLPAPPSFSLNQEVEMRHVSMNTILNSIILCVVFPGSVRHCFLTPSN